MTDDRRLMRTCSEDQKNIDRWELHIAIVCAPQTKVWKAEIATLAQYSTVLTKVVVQYCYSLHEVCVVVECTSDVGCSLDEVEILPLPQGLGGSETSLSRVTPKQASSTLNAMAVQPHNV